MRLADEFSQPGGIDLLIGADIFYEILRAGRSTRPGDYPVLQEKTFGWTISGRTPAVTHNEPQHTFMLQENNRLKQRGRNLHCRPPPPVAKEKGSNPKTQITSGQGAKPSTLSKSTPRRREPEAGQKLEHSNWLATEVNTTTDKLEIRYTSY
jgi:hypothetical protein